VLLYFIFKRWTEIGCKVELQYCRCLSARDLLTTALNTQDTGHRAYRTAVNDLMHRHSAADDNLSLTATITVLLPTEFSTQALQL
jgi:hypothetical protein